jgi:hypothetical protein
MQNSDWLAIASGAISFGLAGLLKYLTRGRQLFVIVCVLLFGIWSFYHWYSFPEYVPVSSAVPLLSATAMPKDGAGLLLGNIAPVAGDKTSQWDVDISGDGYLIARYDRSKSENNQGDLRFSEEIQNAGQFNTRVGLDGAILFWIKPPSVELFAEKHPQIKILFRAPDGQSYQKAIPFTLLNMGP